RRRDPGRRRAAWHELLRRRRGRQAAAIIARRFQERRSSGRLFLFHPVTRRLSPINCLVAKKLPVARRKNPMSRTCLAVILAAGDSTRMKSSMSKVLHPVAGRPMIGHVMDAVSSAGITDAALVLGRD